MQDVMPDDESLAQSLNEMLKQIKFPSLNKRTTKGHKKNLI